MRSALVPKRVVLPQAASEIVAGYAHSGALLDHNRLFLWGFGEEGQLGAGTEHSHPVPREVRRSGLAGALSWWQTTSPSDTHCS